MGMLCGGAELLSCVRLFATPRTVASQAPLSMGFSRQKYRSGLPCPPPRDLPDPGTEPTSPSVPALQADSVPLSHQGCPFYYVAKDSRLFFCWLKLERSQALG